MLAFRRGHQHFCAAEAMALTDAGVNAQLTSIATAYKACSLENSGRDVGQVGLGFANAYPR